MTRTKSVFCPACLLDKVGTRTVFVRVDKIGTKSEFVSDRQKHLYISYISGECPFPQSQGKEVWRLEAAAAHNFFPTLTRAIFKNKKERKLK